MTTLDETNMMIAGTLARTTQEAADAAVDRLRLHWLECQRLQSIAKIYGHLAEFRLELLTNPTLRANVSKRYRVPS
jgi:hypothetical protein